MNMEINADLIECLRNAFEAGQAFENECHCGECHYCIELGNGKRSPDFETWCAFFIIEKTFNVS
jgi:hypothetical protein